MSSTVQEDRYTAVTALPCASDPSVPPSNGRAPLLELPVEVLKLIASYMWPMLPTGRPELERAGTTRLSIENPNISGSQSHALVATCKQLRAQLSQEAFTHIEWILTGLYDGKRDIDSQYVIKLIPPNIAKHARYMSGDLKTIQQMLELLPNSRVNKQAIAEQQLDLRILFDGPEGNMKWGNMPQEPNSIEHHAKAELQNAFELYTEYPELRGVTLALQQPYHLRLDLWEVADGSISADSRLGANEKWSKTMTDFVKAYEAGRQKHQPLFEVRICDKAVEFVLEKSGARDAEVR